MCAEIVQNGSLDSAETEIVRVSLNFHGAKMQLVFLRRAPSRARTRLRRAPRFTRSVQRKSRARSRSTRSKSCRARGQLVDYRAAGISQSKQPSNLVIGLAGRILASAPEAAKLEA